ncbi:hypothetical protein HDU85_000117 [Gaertneriomyces sp. JEL0708]|nr:hypothetical protein HDU85_000117 [Gaertneriomyces sp. JEL0708]
MLGRRAICSRLAASLKQKNVATLPAFMMRYGKLPVRPTVIPKAIVRHATFGTSASSRVNDVPPVHPSRQKQKKKKVLRDLRQTESPVVVPGKEPLRATAFCTAEEYDFAELLPLLRRTFVLLPFIADDVYHVRLVDPAEAAATTDTPSDAPEAFFFPDGTFATWGASDAQNDAIRRLVKKVECNGYSLPETEWYPYVVDPDQNCGIRGDTIVIGDSLLPSEARLAYSSGLVRSVKLAVLEEMLERNLETSKKIPHLLRQGSLPKRADVLRDLAALYSLRGQVNLHNELLDTPDFCWSSGRMEEAFDRISRNLDLRERIGVFNKKLDYANDLTQVLKSLLDTEHGTRLEWIIIILIAVEVVFGTFHFYHALESRYFNNESERHSTETRVNEFVADDLMDRADASMTRDQRRDDRDITGRRSHRPRNQLRVERSEEEVVPSASRWRAWVPGYSS